MNSKDLRSQSIEDLVNNVQDLGAVASQPQVKSVRGARSVRDCLTVYLRVPSKRRAKILPLRAFRRCHAKFLRYYEDENPFSGMIVEA